MLCQSMTRLLAVTTSLVWLGVWSVGDTRTRYPLMDRPAPEVLQHLMAGPAGNFRLSDHRGEVVLIGFWTSWCTGCAEYLARLQALDERYAAAGLVVLGVGMDDDHRAAAEFVRDRFKALRTSNDHPDLLGAAYGVDDVPMTVLIDRDGIIRFAHMTDDYANQQAILREVKGLLDE